MFVIISLAITPVAADCALWCARRRAPHDRGRRFLLRGLRTSCSILRMRNSNVVKVCDRDRVAALSSPSGFISFLGLTALAVTSTDGHGAPARRAAAGRGLHPAHLCDRAARASSISFSRTKLNVWWPTLIAGLVGWLLGYRIMVRGRSGGALPR